MDAFEKMKEKVEMLESQAEVSGQLAAGTGSSLDSESRFRQLEASSKVDDELSRMKRQLAAPEASKALPASPASAVSPGSREALRLALRRPSRTNLPS